MKLIDISSICSFRFRSHTFSNNKGKKKRQTGTKKEACRYQDVESKTNGHHKTAVRSWDKDKENAFLHMFSKQLFRHSLNLKKRGKIMENPLFLVHPTPHDRGKNKIILHLCFWCDPPKSRMSQDKETCFFFRCFAQEKNMDGEVVFILKNLSTFAAR